MRIPNRILEHPIEAAIACLLLLALLFGSADFGTGGNTTTPPANSLANTLAQKF